MDEYQIEFDSDFMAALVKMMAEQNDGTGIEFAELIQIAADYQKIILEYSDNSIKCYKRMVENGEMSERLFELLSNKEITENDYENASEDVKEEYREFCKKSMKGEVNRIELQETYIKAIQLRRRLLKAHADYLPAIINDYDLPESLKYGICNVVADMQNQLDTIVLQSLT